MVMYYKSLMTGKNGKPEWKVVDEDGKIVDTSPSNERLKNLKYDRMIKKKYTDEELFGCLTRFHKKNGRPPMQSDFENDPMYPSAMTYSNRFGSWNNALEKVGLIARRGGTKKYADEELLARLVRFDEKNGRPPTEDDFTHNSEYPHFSTYWARFGSWENAKKLVGLDTDTLARKGFLDTSDQKARLAEIIVLEHFEQYPVDLSGGNCRSPCDGICPNGQTYDVKSSGLARGTYYHFDTSNKHKDDIEIYYLLGFNYSYTKLEHVWRVPGEIAESDRFIIGLYDGEFNVGNMVEYEITDKFADIQLERLEILGIS